MAMFFRRSFHCATCVAAAGLSSGTGRRRWVWALSAPAEDEWVASEQYVFALVEEVQADG